MANIQLDADILTAQEQLFLGSSPKFTPVNERLWHVPQAVLLGKMTIEEVINERKRVKHFDCGHLGGLLGIVDKPIRMRFSKIDQKTKETISPPEAMGLWDEQRHKLITYSYLTTEIYNKCKELGMELHLGETENNKESESQKSHEVTIDDHKYLTLQELTYLRIIPTKGHPLSHVKRFHEPLAITTGSLFAEKYQIAELDRKRKELGVKGLGVASRALANALGIDGRVVVRLPPLDLETGETVMGENPSIAALLNSGDKVIIPSEQKLKNLNMRYLQMCKDADIDLHLREQPSLIEREGTGGELKG